MKHSDVVKGLRMPASLAKRPVNEQGYVVPWFTPYNEDEGRWDFRFQAPGARDKAVRYDLCWTCGERLTLPCAFVIGPMCAVNRTSAEPPSHVDCAIYSARACPFLAQPKMVRASARLADIEELRKSTPGFAIERNPGVALVWVTKAPVFNVHSRLFEIGHPERVMFYARSRKATRQEILKSIETGLPILQKVAEDQGEEAVAELKSMVDVAMELVPA